MSLFKQPNEITVSSTIKMLVYGQPGMGKSTLALSAPDPVLFDFDGGVNRVNKAFQCPTLQVSNWDDVGEALTELKAGAVPCKTVVIDTAGKMLDYMSDYIMEKDSNMKMRNGCLAVKGYGKRKVMFINFLRDVTLMRKNIVFVAHEKEEKDGDTRIVRPDIGGSSRGDLLKELDLVGYLQAIGEERVVNWSPQEKFYAKNACNLPPYMKVPTIINQAGEVVAQNEFLTNIFKAYNDYLVKQANVGIRYNEMIEQIFADIDAVSDLDTLNATMGKVAGYEHLWDSKARAGVALNEKAADMGYKYNKVTKRYELA